MARKMLKEWKKPKKIASAEKMWSLFGEYVEETKANPFVTTERVSSGKKAGEISEHPKKVPYLWVGFESYLAMSGVMTTDLSDYKNNKGGNYDEYSQVMATIDNVIRTQNYEGAAVRAFDSNLIARLAGLTEKREILANLTNDGEIDYSKLSSEALEEIAEARKAARTNDWNYRGPKIILPGEDDDLM